MCTLTKVRLGPLPDVGSAEASLYGRYPRVVDLLRDRVDQTHNPALGLGPLPREGAATQGSWVGFDDQRRHAAEHG